uniref:Tr-type G domain-containing protein n=1 Tax=Guillardia theta (strain CCMP2712) TaxID=905079 RepID=A0A0C3TSK9_GUITC
MPGLLLIDTPGHKNFSNLRARGASYCDLAVVVVDIMHGLESETIESIKLLRKHRIPFLVALNKIDRLYGWESHPSMTVKETIEMQSEAVKIEYQKLFESTILQLQEQQGLNASVFFENRNNRTVVNVVPTSGLSGDGIVDLLYLLFSLSEKMLINKIKYQDEVECKVLDVRTIDGSRTVLDAIVVNGRLKEKQKILVGGLDGPIITHVRSLLTTIAPRDSRSKLNYAQNAEVKGTISVKICANGIERAAAGSRLYIINDEREETALKEKVMKDLDPFISKFRRGGDGVHIQAMSFGSLEALFDFLDGANNHPIPVSGVGIGPVSKYNVKKTSIILEREKENAKACDKEYAKLGRWVSGNPFSSFNEAYACILAYEAPVLPDAEKAAKELGIPIVRSDALLQLVESVNARVTEVKQKKQTMADQMLMDACTHGTPEVCISK